MPAASEATPLKADGTEVSTVPSGMPWVVQLVSAIVILFDVIFGWEMHPLRGYTAAVGTLGVVFSVAGFVLLKSFYDITFTKELFPVPKLGAMSFEPCTVGSLLATITLVWWTIGAGVLTFDGPYTYLCNGFVATWGGFLGALYAVGFKHSDESGKFMLEPLFFLIVGSVVVFFATISAFPNVFPYHGNTVYGLVVSLLSILASCTWFILDILKPAAFQGKEETVKMARAVVFAVLAVMWIIAALLLTFKGPFNSTLMGNGYVGAWGSLIAALFCSAADTSPFVTAVVAMKTKTEALLPKKGDAVPSAA